MKDPVATASGGVGFSFTQELRLPKFVEDVHENRRNLKELTEINVARDIVNMSLLVNSDEEIRNFEYDIYIKNWTSKGVEFQIEFENPLAIS